MGVLDDPSVRWQLATPFGIQIDKEANAWNSGHVNDVIVFPDRTAILVATESGGLWVLTENADPLPLSLDWDTPDVKSVALGPDGERHLFAGCTIAYDSAEKRAYRDEAGSAPVLMETDPGRPAPLLEWHPVADALPFTAGRITRIVILPLLRRIVVSCAAVRNDSGGIFWAVIPPNRFASGDPPRAAFQWKQAKVLGDAARGGFWDVAIAATHNDQPRTRLEDKRKITIVAGGYKRGGVFVGQWNGADELVLELASVAYDDGSDATAVVFGNCGTTSISSCEQRPATLYAACAWPDGRLNCVLRSKDGGRHWLVCPAKVAFSNPVDPISLATGQQGQDWNNCISAHPGNPSIAALGWAGGPFVTYDAGATWVLATEPPPTRKHLHDDLHALVFDRETPDSIGMLYVGSDGGLARVNLDDLPGALGPAFRSDYNRKLPTLQCFCTLSRQFTGTLCGASTRPGIIAGGFQDNGNLSCTLHPPGPWFQVDYSDGGWNATVAGEGYVHRIMSGPVVATAPLGPSVQVKTVPITVPAPGNANGLFAEFGEPVIAPSYRNAAGDLLVAAAAPSNSSEVYGLFLETGVTYHWELVASIPGELTVTSLGSFDGNLVHIAASKGRMFCFDMSNRTLKELDVKLPKPAPSTRMSGGTCTRIVGFRDGTLFATLLGTVETPVQSSGTIPIVVPTPKPGGPAVQGYVLRLNGDTWTPTAGAGLPNEYVYGFCAIEAANTRVPHGLMAATDAAVYLSRDDGDTWVRASAGLPRRAHCADLRFVTDMLGGMSVYLGTFGWSVWSADLASGQ